MTSLDLLSSTFPEFHIFNAYFSLLQRYHSQLCNIISFFYDRVNFFEMLEKPQNFEFEFVTQILIFSFYILLLAIIFCERRREKMRRVGKLSCQWNSRRGSVVDMKIKIQHKFNDFFNSAEEFKFLSTRRDFSPDTIRSFYSEIHTRCAEN